MSIKIEKKQQVMLIFISLLLLRSKSFVKLNMTKLYVYLYQVFTVQTTKNNYKKST